MGLAGPRKRTKIAHDPNNTAWARSEGFGHNMLVSQGWEPGQTLGARNAAHAHTYTAGSTSHIRTLLRQDGLGLGASSVADRMGTESTGLDAFQGILGRLNGKSDQALEKEQQSRDDLRRKIYAEGKWGRLSFISGGILKGEDISSIVVLPQEESAASESGSEQFSDEPARKAAKLARKEAKRLRKAEKAQRKLDRATKKAAKIVATATVAVSTDKAAEEVSPTPDTQAASITAVKIRPAVGRHAVRQRFIKQKQSATMDARALNEILMIKSG